MAELAPSKDDIEVVFKRLRAVSSNKVCFDCNSKNPTWATVTYGVFICIDCSAVHRSLGVHLTFVRSTQLDTSWTWIQLRNMQLGGNANARTFFQQHNCTSTDAQQKYNSRAAQLYKEKLLQMSQRAMKIHGTQVHIEGSGSQEQSTEPQGKEVDFFEEHITVAPMTHEPLTNLINQNVNMNTSDNGNVEYGGPNVDAALNMSPREAQKLHDSQPHKSTIGQRRPANKLGSKKLGGLGAQRVKTDFSKLEKNAERKDQMKKETAKPSTPSNPEEQQQTLACLNEVYENLSLNSKREGERMKKTDPKKAEQAERLGMGLGSRSTISHSMFGEMKTIEQENPSKSSNSLSNILSGSGTSSFRDEEIEDDFDTVIRFNSGPPKYKDSPFEDGGGLSGGKNSGIEDLLSADKKQSLTSSDWENDFEKVEKPSVSNSNYNSSTWSSSSNSKVSASANYKYKTYEETTAQTKFGNAKSISSDMYFQDGDANSEMRSTLQRFEGSSSISSADLFGQPQNQSRNNAYGTSIQAPDLDEVKESVRQGVTKVAGRLSNMATNVMASLQDRYQ